MNPLNVKVADKVYFNDQIGTVVSVSKRGNAVVEFDTYEKYNDCTVIVRLEDRAVLDFKGDYIENDDVYSESEYLEHKKQMAMIEKENDMWNKFHPIEPIKPLNVKKGDKIYFGLYLYGTVVSVSKKGNAVIEFHDDTLDNLTMRLSDRACLTKKGKYITKQYLIHSEAERNAELEKESQEYLEHEIWNEIQNVVADESGLSTFNDLKKVIKKHAEYFK